MKNRTIILTFCLVTVFLLCSCQLFLPVSFADILAAAQRGEPLTSSAVSGPTPTPESFNSAISMSEVTRFEESEEFAYTITMAHPLLENAGGQGDSFNTIVSLKLLASVNEFRSFAEQSYEEMQDLGGSSSYTLDYEVYRFDDHFISIQFYAEVYFIGAAHPGTTHFVINYDRLTQEEVTIGGLFLPNSHILNVLQFYCAEELNYRFPDGYFDKGLQTVADNYRNWNLSDEGLVLTFETYQVQAGAAGPQTVLIPYYLLEEFINPEGPLGYVLDKQNQEYIF